MAGLIGFEPMHTGVKVRCLAAWLQPYLTLPVAKAWGFSVHRLLPVSQKVLHSLLERIGSDVSHRTICVGYANRCRECLIPPYLKVGVLRLIRKCRPLCGDGADSRTRTYGLLITNQLLFLLSYVSKCGAHGLRTGSPYRRRPV